jgi:hypothetical protein
VGAALIVCSAQADSSRTSLVVRFVPNPEVLAGSRCFPVAPRKPTSGVRAGLSRNRGLLERPYLSEMRWLARFSYYRPAVLRRVSRSKP